MGNKSIYNSVKFSFPSAWPSKSFEDVLVKNLPSYKKYKQKEILSQGKIPVVDQGSERVAGYINDESGKYGGELPLIIFGDHTRKLKYIDYDFAVGADGTKLLKPIDKLLEKFFFYYLKSVFVPSSGYSRHYKYLKEIDVPIPDKGIQQEIIDDLDSLLPRVQAQESRLINVDRLIKQFRQSIYAAAISGRLTEGWRSQNTTTLKQPIKYTELSKKKKVQFDIEHFDLFDVPEEWEWKQFWEVAEIMSNLVPPKNYQDYTLVAPDNIEKRTGKLLEKKLVSDIRPISSKHLFFKGQIVYSKIRPYLSKLIYADFDGLCSADMYPISSNINVHYLMIYMLSPYFVGTVSNIGSRTLLPKTNQEELNSIPVPVPSMEEQAEIVARVRNYLNIAEASEAQLKKAKVKLGLLDRAILAKKFSDDQATD